MNMKWLLCIIVCYVSILSADPLAGHPPVANRDSVTTTDNERISGNLLTNDIEPDGEIMIPSLVTAPVNGTLVQNSNGSFTYTPNNNYTGLDSFTCQVCDASLPPSLCDTAVAIVNVLPVNDKPEITAPPSIEVAENWANIITGISFYDEDAGSAGVAVSLTTAAGIFNATSGIGVTVTGSGSGSLTITGSITNINAFIATPHIIYTTALNASGNVVMTVDIDDNGATGPGGRQTTSGTISLIVKPKNDPPVAQDDVVEVVEDTPASGNVLTNDTDPEGDALTASLVTAPVNGTVVLNADGSYTYTPGSYYYGRDSLVYQVCDNGTPSLCDTTTLRMNVEAVNNKPVVTAPNTINVIEDVAGNVTGISFSDPDAGTADVTTTFKVTTGILTAVAGGGVAVTGSGSGTLTLTGSITNINAFSGLQYTTAPNASGNVYLYVAISDNGATGSGGIQLGDDTLTLVIDPVNDAPVANDEQVNTPEDVIATGNVLTNDTDIEGNQLTSSLVTAPGKGVVFLNSEGNFTYTPFSDYSGPDSLVYQVCDNGTPSLCDTAIVRFQVGETNDKPAISLPNSINVTEDVTSSLTGISFSDADAGTNDVTATFSVASGTLSDASLTGSIAEINAFIAGGDLKYTPVLNATGNVVLTVHIDDNDVADPQSASGTVTLAIQPVNDPPVNTVPGVQTMNMNTTLTLRNKLSVNDIDSDNMQVTLSATHGSLPVTDVNGTVAHVNSLLASISYTPDVNYYGPASITITTSDSYDTDTDIIPIEIIGDTTPPTITGITRNDLTPTNAASVSYTVRFSEKVTGVDATDFSLALTGTGNGVIGLVTALNDSTYHIQIANLSGTGTLRLDSKGSGTGIADGFANKLPEGIVSGEVYNIDHDAPAVTISAPATVNTPYTATVRFNEAVTGFDTSDIQATNATISNLDETGAGVYTVLVTPQYRGVVNISIPAGAARDAAGNNSKAAVTVSTKVLANYVMDKIYPIPADTWITIRLKGITVPEMHVLISDMTGRVVYKQFRQVTDKMIKVNVGGLAAGTYVIIVRAAAFRHTQKISIGR